MAILLKINRFEICLKVKWCAIIKKRDQDVNEDDIKNAILAVVDGSMKLRSAAAVYKVKPNTLFYRIKKYKANKPQNGQVFSSKYTVAQVFTSEEERMLREYLLKSSKMNYGLTYKQARSLAYEYATALKKCPIKWTEKKEAGIEWLKGFMKRHKDLSLRKPENTSLSRSTSFNKHNVSQFYDNYEKVLQRTNFAPERIYNLDETNIMTVVQAPNVIARKGTKQIGQCVSAERGQLITMCGIVNAIGNALPPVFIFPRARFHDSMLFGAPIGSVGYANSPNSGWMTGPLFIKVLEHLKRLTRCSKEDPILLLMDNHESHCTLDASIYCRENGIVALTFPPHCTHRMQPLDVSVNGPFKQKLSVAQNDWLLSHPGKTITIHDLASIVTPAYNASYIARNIIAGFMKPGIHPFSRNAFCDEDFECAEVTNRPMPTTSASYATSDVLQTTSAAPDTDCEEVEQEINCETSPTGCDILVSPPVSPSIIDSTSVQLVVSDVGPSLSMPATGTVPSVTELNIPPITSAVSPPSVLNALEEEPTETWIIPSVAASAAVITPEVVRPFPKALPRKESNKGRKKGKSRILTDTPEKEEIQKAYLERQARLKKSQKIVLIKKRANSLKTKALKRKKAKTILTFSSDETDSEIYLESEEESTINSEGTDENEDVDYEKELNSSDIKLGDYVLAQLASEGNKISLVFVGKNIEKHGHDFTISFLKKKGVSNKFFFPEKTDESYISMSDILVKLPPPIEAAGTSRTAAMITFKFNFSKFKLG